MSVIMLLFFIVTRMSRKGSSVGLCSSVKFIFGCRFCSKVWSSLISPHEVLQRIKQSSRYLFQDFMKSVFILCPYFCSILS